MNEHIPYILAFFSNPPEDSEDHLVYIDEESEGLQEIFDTVKAKEEIHLEYRPVKDEATKQVKRDMVAEKIYQWKNKYTVIHYSGHANYTLLSMQAGNLLAQSFVKFISQCQKLKLVVLNGCCTNGFVGHLLEKTNVNAVIATTDKVDDYIAKDFSKAFYERLADKQSLEDAFTNALAIALDNYDNDKYIWQAGMKDGVLQDWSLLFDHKREGKLLREVKKVVPLQEDKSDLPATWGLYIKKQDILDWKLFESEVESEKIDEQMRLRILALNAEIMQRELSIKNLQQDIAYLKGQLTINAGDQYAAGKLKTQTEELQGIQNEINNYAGEINTLQNERQQLSLEREDDYVITRYSRNFESLNYTSQDKYIQNSKGNNEMFRGFILQGTPGCALDQLARKLQTWLGMASPELIYYDFGSGGINDFWQTLLSHLPNVSGNQPEIIAREFYRKYMKPDGTTQNNFLLIFRNFKTGDPAQDDIGRIFAFLKQLKELFKDDTNPLVNPRIYHYVCPLIIDNTCELVKEKVYRSSKEKEYTARIDQYPSLKNSMFLLPVVEPLANKHISDWERISGIPPAYRNDMKGLRKVLKETAGIFLPTLKEVTTRNMKINDKKRQMLFEIADSLEKSI